jgi:tetratricopeptide (TPR) repeat protein
VTDEASSREEARELFRRALERHAARDTAASIELTREAVERDPSYVEALEHLAVLLVTRRRAYREGLDAIERTVAARDDDPGLWYTLGWCYEFAAHEIARRGSAEQLEVPQLYERAAEGFRRCLALHPEGKLVDDAEDLLEHVENELSG